MVSLCTLLALVFSPFAAVNHLALPRDSKDFVFISLGDNRPAGMGLGPTANFREMLKEVSIIGPAFVISSGDLLYGNDEPVELYQKEIDEMKPLLETLPFPFFNAPGNHEMAKPEFVPIYVQRMGDLYGSFEYGGIRFVALNTDVPGDAPGVHGEELAWLKGVLADVKPTVIFQHHPVFPRPSNDEKASSAVDDPVGLSALYKSGGAILVEEGHDHVFNLQLHDGVTYAIGGGAGAPLDAQPMDGGFFHFNLDTVADGKITQVPIPLGCLEVTPLEDAKVAVAVYSNTDLPIANLRIPSKRMPTGVTASATNHGKTASVKARLIRVETSGSGYIAVVGLLAPHARATIVSLQF